MTNHRQLVIKQLTQCFHDFKITLILVFQGKTDHLLNCTRLLKGHEINSHSRTGEEDVTIRYN